MDNILEVKNLCKTYDNFKLENVSFTLPCGTIMGFIGKNGAGKSTTIKLILDLINLESGEFSVLGESNMRNNPHIKEQIGVVLENGDCFDYLTINALNKILKATYKTWNSEKFFEYSEKFSLPKNQKIKSFSKGMKMKVSIAAALSHDSRLLIFDEPTSGLDPVVRNEILDILMDFIQDETRSVFISSHILSDLEKVCDYIAFIDKGKLVLCEEKDVLLEKYALIKCSPEKIAELDKSAIVGISKNYFGAEALVLSDKIPQSFEKENTTIEDIMLYLIKGD